MAVLHQSRLTPGQRVLAAGQLLGAREEVAAVGVPGLIGVVLGWCMLGWSQCCGVTIGVVLGWCCGLIGVVLWVVLWVDWVDAGVVLCLVPHRMLSLVHVCAHVCTYRSMCMCHIY